MKEPRVKEILEHYKKGNVVQVYKYLTEEDMLVDPSTWAGKLKRDIELERFESVKQTIELVAYKFINL